MDKKQYNTSPRKSKQYKPRVVTENAYFIDNPNINTMIEDEDSSVNASYQQE